MAYVLNFFDEWDEVAETHDFETLEEAVDYIKEAVAAGNVALSNVQLLQQVNFKINIDIEIL